MGIEIDLLKNYPKTKRNVKERGKIKTEKDRKIAREFGEDFFDGDRKNGYGGFHYNPRFWQPVIPTFKKHFGLTCDSTVLDIGCAKGFMLHDLAEEKGYGLIKLKKTKDIKKVILCSGKVYFDLVQAREKLKINNVVFIRIEQLYPFPIKSLVSEIKKYKTTAQFYWCQEEPKNMGAWNTARNYIEWTLDHIKAENKEVIYIGRQPAASPATGYLKKHLAQQKEIIEKVLS